MMKPNNGRAIKWIKKEFKIKIKNVINLLIANVRRVLMNPMILMLNILSDWAEKLIDRNGRNNMKL